MGDEKNVSIARDFLRALEAKHVEQVLSCFPDDGVWIAPEGTFTGKAQIEHYLDWQFGQAKDMKIAEYGNGTIVEGNRAFMEYAVTYRQHGERIEYVVLCALELKSGALKTIRTVYDRLSLGRKVARGRLSRWAIDRAVRQAQKGLRWPRS